MDFQTFFCTLEKVGIVPVVKLEDTADAVSLAKALIDGGIPCAEVTFRAEGADKVIEAIAKKYPKMLVGAGTVLTTEQVDRAIDSGASFCVAPGLNPKIVEHCLSRGVPFVPGVSSASEIETALELGLQFLKFFPAEQAGGLSYIKALCAPYTSVKFMPTGGVNESNLLDYLAYEKIVACGGSWMVKPELLLAKKWEEITALSRQAISRMLGFELDHVGINADNEGEAVGIADSFNGLFGFAPKQGNSSVFAGRGIEIMKTKYLGKNGHIAIRTNSVERAIFQLGLNGYEIQENTIKLDAKGKISAVYLKQSLGGFALHLVKK